MENLTSKEIDIIVEALSIWEERCSPGDINPIEVGTFNMDAPNIADAVINKLQEVHRLHEKAHTDRREISTMLKAKLIGVKQSRAIEVRVPGPRCLYCGGPHFGLECPDKPKISSPGTPL